MYFYTILPYFIINSYQFNNKILSVYLYFYTPYTTIFFFIHIFNRILYIFILILYTWQRLSLLPCTILTQSSSWLRRLTHNINPQTYHEKNVLWGNASSIHSTGMTWPQLPTFRTAQGDTLKIKNMFSPKYSFLSSLPMPGGHGREYRLFFWRKHVESWLELIFPFELA